MSKQYTKYQKINQFFKKNNAYTQDTVSIDSSELIASVNDKEEFELLKLQKQQKKYLKSQIRKVGRTIDQRSIIHEAQRIPAYYDYDIMAYHEVIGRALEIYTEEAVTPDEDGKILKINSNNQRVKEELEHLFYTKLNIHSTLPMVVYQTIKNGDFFWHLEIDDVEGVVNAKEIPAIEMERVESNYMARFFDKKVDEGEIIFRWKNDNIIDFPYWTIAHFRMMLDQDFLPYGTSILEKCRRLWKNLVLAEDAMLSMHIIRGVDRLIYNIDVGNIDPEDVPAYLDESANNFKRKIKVDPKTGQYDLKHNLLAIDQDLFIPKRNSNDATKVDKLEGTSQIDTSVFDKLMEKLVAALGIPLSYLNYKETAGEGKTLSMHDIRFSRTVQRIQQSIIQELNKVAIVHLIALGLEEELDSFYISMNNPSIQKTMLELEVLAQQVSLYRDATDFSSGIAAMSTTNAKKKIFGWSDDEIRHDLLQQRMERAVIFELEATNEVIPKSGLFDDVDNLYGDPNAASGGEGDETPELGSGGGGGLGGGMSGLGGDDLSLDELEGEDEDTGAEGEDIDLTDEGGDKTDDQIGESLIDNIEKLLKG